MIFTETKLRGVFVITPEKIEDERGFFARTWCAREFEDRGLETKVAQCSISFNLKKGALRGLHYQVLPYEETKIVRCTKGAMYDVILDLRADSPTYKHWLGIEITADDHRMLYIPKGLAHGFQTLSEHTEVFYQISEPYVPQSAAGIRWNDPTFAIEWPLEISAISERDASFASFQA